MSIHSINTFLYTFFLYICILYIVFCVQYFSYVQYLVCISVFMLCLYVLCSLYAPIHQSKFQVGVNLLGNKYSNTLILILILTIPYLNYGPLPCAASLPSHPSFSFAVSISPSLIYRQVTFQSSVVSTSNRRFTQIPVNNYPYTHTHTHTHTHTSEVR